MDVLWPHYGVGMHQAAALLLVPDTLLVLPTMVKISLAIGIVSLYDHKCEADSFASKHENINQVGISHVDKIIHI